MALLSGEVETQGLGSVQDPQRQRGSGWLCYPGKLKPPCVVGLLHCLAQEFRMALLSGEVETRVPTHEAGARHGLVRMALLSGEVET